MTCAMEDDDKTTADASARPCVVSSEELVAARYYPGDRGDAVPAAPCAIAAVELDSTSDDEFMPLCDVPVVVPTAHSVIESLSEQAVEKAAKTVARRQRRNQLLHCCTRQARE